MHDEKDDIYGICYDGITHYFVQNVQGDIIGILNTTGTLVAKYEYDAWGNVTAIPVAEDGCGHSVDSPDHIAHVNPFRYRGYYYDAETEFYWLQSRYYDPEVGRFLNSDKVIAGIGESLQGYNVFAYCFNNPINLSDPTGNWPKWVYNAGNTIKSFTQKVVKTTKAIFNAASAYIGLGRGVGASAEGTLCSIPLGADLYAKTDVCSVEIAEGEIFYGITSEYYVSANVANVGPTVGKKRQHAYNHSDECYCAQSKNWIIKSFVYEDCLIG